MINNLHCAIGCILLPVVGYFKTTTAYELLVQEPTEPTEKYLQSTYLSRKNMVYLIVGLVGLLLFFITGFYLFYNHIDANEWCHWCSNLNCIQAWSVCHAADES